MKNLNEKIAEHLENVFKQFPNMGNPAVITQLVSGIESLVEEKINEEVENAKRFQPNVYSERLVKEWLTHGKVIIGADFDCTLSPWETLNNHDDIERTINLLKLCKKTAGGCFIVIHTSSHDHRNDEIRKYCESIGLEIDTINQTPIELAFGGPGSKPYCNHYLDDRASLPHSLDMLENVVYNVIGQLESKKSLDGVA